MPTTIYDFTVQTIDNKEKSLGEYRGKTLIIVNVASNCGLTPQYESLQRFYEEFQSQGIEILGFPANNFASQEPGSNDEIAAFCAANFHITFPMFSKISVKGDDCHELYTYLTSQTQSEVIWNFHKFIVEKDGLTIHSIPPQQSVTDEEFKAKLMGIIK